MKLRLVVTLLALVMISVVWAAPRAAGVEESQHATGSEKNPDPQIVRQQHQAWEKDGLRAAAAVSGYYRLTIDPHHGINADTLESLVKHSPVVIVGHIVSNRCWLTAKGDKITTDYEVIVVQSLKGQFRPADRLTMSVLGGKVDFRNGSAAQVDPVGMVLPFNGERYILFLESTRLGPSAAQKAAAKGPIYAPSFQSLSLFRIGSNGLVHPKAFREHRIARAYAAKPESRLVDDVLVFVPKAKQ